MGPPPPRSNRRHGRRQGTVALVLLLVVSGLVLGPDLGGLGASAAVGSGNFGAFALPGFPAGETGRLSLANALAAPLGPSNVSQTLVLANNSTIPGNFVPSSAAYYPYAGTYDARGDSVWWAAGVLVAFNGTRELTNRTFAEPGGFFTAVGLDPTTDQLFAPDYYTGNASVINASTLSVVAHVGVGSNPSSVTYDNATGEMYVANSGSGNVTVINATTLATVANLSTGNAPIGVAIDPALQEAFVANEYSNNLTIVNTSSLLEVGSIGLPTGCFFGCQPQSVEFDPQNGTIWVAMGSAREVTVVDAQTGSLVANISVGGRPADLTYSPAYNEMFVSNVHGWVSEINATTYALNPGTVPAVGPAGMVDDPHDGVLWVGMPGQNAVTNNMRLVNESSFTTVRTVSTNGPSMDDLVFDPATNQLVSLAGADGLLVTLNETTPALLGAVPLPGYSTPLHGAYDAGDGLLWVGESGGNDTVALYAGNYSFAANISVQNPASGLLPAEADAVAVDPANHTVFVTELGSQYVAAVDDQNFQVVAQVPVGSEPAGIAYDSAMNEILVANEASNNLTIFNASTYASVGSVAVGSSPDSVAYDSANDEVYTADYASDLVTVINTTTDRAVANVSVGVGPWAVVADPASGLLYVSNSASDNLSVLNGRTNGVVSSIPVGTDPTGISINESTGTIYVANDGSSSLSVLPACPTTSCLTISSLQISPSPASAGQPMTVSVSVEYAVGNVTYGYLGLPRGCVPVNASNLTCAPEVGGTFNITEWARDSTGRNVSANATVVVTAPVPTVHAFAFSPTSIHLGRSSTVTANVTGGGSWLAFAYSDLPPGCTSQNLSSFSCTPTSTGSYTVNLTVTNSYDEVATAQASLSVTADPHPNIGSFTATPASAYLGGTVTLVVNTTGTHGRLGYTYENLPAGCASANLSVLACTPTVTGNFTVTVTVTNLLAQTAQANVTFQILPDPRPSLTGFSASPPTVNRGSPTSFTVDASVSVGWLEYDYTGLPSGCTPTNASTVPCTPIVSGTFTVSVTVTDEFGESVGANTTLVVTDYTPPTISSFSASTNPVYVTHSTTLTVLATGTSLTFSYTGLPPGCLSSDSSTLLCTPNQAGTFTVKVVVTGVGGLSSSATLSISVVTPPTLILASFVSAPSSVQIGNSAVLTASVTGPVGAVTYVYTGLPSGCSSTNASTLDCRPSSTGVYNVSVAATDQLGRSVHGSLALTVTLAVGATGVPSPPAGWGVLALVAVAILAIVIVALFLARGRGTAAPEASADNPSPSTEDWSETPGPP
jgi:YVTN family beta-propeller protein